VSSERDDPASDQAEEAEQEIRTTAGRRLAIWIAYFMPSKRVTRTFLLP
jgi:hypothetical protein